MRQRRGGVYGPYVHRRQWRVDVVSATGERACRLFETEGEALAVIRDTERELGLETGITAEKAIEAYELHLRAKGNKPRSIGDTVYRVRRLLGDWKPRQLRLLSAKEAGALYTKLAAEVSVDSHRNMLAEVKTWARWCVEQRYIKASPFRDVNGIGRRRHGKLQPRIDECRKWLARALELAHLGEAGAVAAMMAALMGMRCSEIVKRQVRDLDDGGQLLWIPDSKTPAGKRPLGVPSLLQELLLEQAEGKGPMEPLLSYRDRATPRKWVQRICADVKIPKITAHGMRGFTSTCAVDTGIDPDLVAKMMGHASPTTTMQSYAAPGAGEAARQERALRVIAGGRRG